MRRGMQMVKAIVKKVYIHYSLYVLCKEKSSLNETEFVLLILETFFFLGHIKMKTQIIVGWVIILFIVCMFIKRQNQEEFQPIPVCGIDPTSAFMQGIRQNLRQMETVRPREQIPNEIAFPSINQGTNINQFSLYGGQEESKSAQDWNNSLFVQPQFQPQLPQQNWANQFQPQFPQQNWANQFQPQLPQQNWANQFQTQLPPQNRVNQFQPMNRIQQQGLPMLPVYNRQNQPVELPLPVGLERPALVRQQQGQEPTQIDTQQELNAMREIYRSASPEVLRGVYGEDVTSGLALPEATQESLDLAQQYAAEMEAVFAKMDLEEARDRLAQEYEAEMEAAFAKMDFDDNLSQLNRLTETLMNSFESELTAEQRAELEDIMFYKDFNNISEIQTELQKISGYEKQIKSRQQEAKQKSEQERQEAEELIINDMSNIAFGSDQLGEMLDDLIKVKGVSTLAELRDVLDVYPEEIDPELNLDGDTVYQGLINTAGEDLIREMVRQGENTSVTQSVLQNAGYTGVTAEELIQAREARQQEERRQDQAMRERAEKAKAERQQREREAEQDIVDRLTSYETIEMTMGRYTAARAKGAIDKYEEQIGRRVESVEDVRQALDTLQEDEYHTFFDVLYTELVTNFLVEPEDYINAEQQKMVKKMSQDIQQRMDISEAVIDLVKNLTTYRMVEDAMGSFTALKVKEALDKYQRDIRKPIETLQEVQKALESIPEYVYDTFFDRLFTEVITPSNLRYNQLKRQRAGDIVRPGDYLNEEQEKMVNEIRADIQERQRNR